MEAVHHLTSSVTFKVTLIDAAHISLASTSYKGPRQVQRRSGNVENMWMLGGHCLCHTTHQANKESTNNITDGEARHNPQKGQQIELELTAF